MQSDRQLSSTSEYPSYSSDVVEDIGNSYWGMIASPFQAMYQYMPSIGINTQNVPYLSTIGNAVGVTTKAIKSGLVYNAFSEQVMTPLVSLAMEYRAYEQRQKKQGPRWVKTKELPVVYEMKKMANRQQALLEAQRKLKQTIKQQEDRLKILNEQLMHLFDIQTDSIQDKRIQLYDVIQLKKNILKQKKSELKEIEENIESINLKLVSVRQKAAEEIKQANIDLLNVATLIEQDFIKNSRDFGEFDQLWPQPISEHEYSQFEIKLNQFISQCGMSAIENLDFDKLRFLVKSRFAILQTNQKLSSEGKKEKIAILVPVHKEFNRLKEVNECITGENFLQTKCEALSWLLEGCNNIEGKLYFVDDQAPHGKPDERIHAENASKTRVAKNKNGDLTPCIHRTIDEIDELLSSEGRLSKYRNMCVCLGYEQLEKQISGYTDEDLKKMSPDELANKSVKAGAVHLGLRYIADEKLADDVLFTDADNSIHLGMIGTMIHERIFNNQRAVIGARRVEGSIVGNKSNDRHQMSFLFNMLNRILLNVQVPDTQVGCKLISVDAIPDISPKMHNLTMAFDVELIRSLQEVGVTPKSLPIYWADSPEESQSSTQANNMFKGVIEIFMKLYGYGQQPKQETLETTTKSNIHLASFDDAFIKLIKDEEAKPALSQALKLAADPVFHFVIKHTEEIYDTLTPEIYRDFINSFSMFLTQLSEGNIERKYILKLLNDIKNLYNNTTQSYAVGFALEKFPGIFSVLELIYRDPSYARVLAPLFLGDAMLGKKFAGMRQMLETSKPEPIAMKSFSDYCKENAIHITDTNMLEHVVGWQEANKLKKTDVLQQTSQTKVSPVKREAPVSKQREDAGWNKLKESLQNPTLNKKPKKVISLVMQFDQSGATDISGQTITGNQYHYWNSVIKGKADALKQCLKEAGLSADDIVINLIIVDARNEEARKKDPYHVTEKVISEIVKNSNADSESSVQCEYYNLAKDAPLTIGSKATAVRQGMRHAILDKTKSHQPDAVGFIDFSQKIRIQEMGTLIANVVSAPDDAPRAAIGTRRAYEAEVVGKRKEFLFRSMACNHVVKAFLPELANLSDTQTGFKLFPANVLKDVLHASDEDAELNINSFAFDVQLLMRLIARGCKIDELPVVFNDNTQDIVDPDLAGPANQMFADFLIISAEEQRRKRKDFHGKKPTFSEPVFMGNGAEHVVFDCGNNMLFKIEAQHVNPNFRLILQHILFNRERLFEEAGKGGDDLFIMQFNKLLQLGMLEQWIPLLRNIPDLNRLVLGAISAWEDKTKSIDLTEVKRRGNGLVGNFTYIDQPFSTTLDGVAYNFEPRHRSKICIRAKGILQDKFVAELKRLNQSQGEIDKHIAESVVNGLKEQVIDPALQLFENMWKRGLFDLDTNIISDLGLFEGKDSKLVVQSLDPGEMITGILNVDVKRAKEVLEKRSDILLMNAQIASIVKQLNLNPTQTQQLIDYLKQEVIGYYTSQMMKFFDRIALEKEEVAKIMERNPGLTEDQACQQAGFDISYGKEWRAAVDKSVFKMEDIQYKLDPPNANAKSYYADQDSKLLSAGYNLPYRSAEAISTSIYPVETVEQSKYEPHIALIVPEGKEALIENKLNSDSKEGIFIHGIERGSIVPLMDFSKHFIQAQQQSTVISRSVQPETNMIFVLDAGGGTRTAGIGQQAGSKGSIKLAGKSLNDHAIKTTKMLAEQLAENGMNDCVIISSCDDLFSNDPGHMNTLVKNMIAYFTPSSGMNESSANPGIYWTDLPDGGRKFMPLTSHDTYEFLKNDKIKGEVKNFLLNILISRGYAEQGLVENTYNIVDQIYQTWLEFLDNESKLKTQSSNTQEAMSLMGGIGALGSILSELTSRYAKLIQWHAIQSKDEISGIKRPFLMVMKKAFFADLSALVERHHEVLDKVKEDITWENFLLRGLKADSTLWMIFKPKNIDSNTWGNIYKELQELKIKHGINTENIEQNKLRALPPVWHNLDDPYALYSAAKEMFESLSVDYGSSQELPLVKVISDNVEHTHKLDLSNPHDYRVELVALGSRLNGVDIEPAYLQDVLVSHQYRENILLYEIKLNPGDKFKPTMGHAHTQHEDKIYSSPIGPFTKEVLKSQPVYVYEKDHQHCLVAKPLFNSKQERVTMATFADYLKSVPAIKNEVRLETTIETSTATNIKMPASKLRQLSMFSDSVTTEINMKPELISLLNEYAKQKETGKSVNTEVKVILANAVLPNLLATKWSDNTMPLDAKTVSHEVEQEMLRIMKAAELSSYKVHFDTASQNLLIRAAKAQIEDTINRYNQLGNEGKYKDFDILVLRCAGKMSDVPLQSKKWSK